MDARSPVVLGGCIALVVAVATCDGDGDLGSVVDGGVGQDGSEGKQDAVADSQAVHTADAREDGASGIGTDVSGDSLVQGDTKFDVPMIELPPECEPPTLKLTRIASGANQPLAVVQLPGDDRIFVAQRHGLIRIFRNGDFLPEPFLDMRASVATFQGMGMGQGERGLINLAFHPNYAVNGRFYVFYTRRVTDPYFVGTRREGDVVVAEGRRSQGDPNRADAALTQLHVVQHDGVNGRNGCCDDGHNGGLLAFGPDGYLYFGVGDGGGAANQFGSLVPGLSTIIRLDVDNPETPPAGNLTGPGQYPFAWAMGVRNPWRGGFDPATGALYFADVGEDRWEELNLLPADTPAGTDFGWGNPGMEGTRVVRYYPYTELDAPAYGHMPIYEYEHPPDPDSRRGGRLSRAVSAAAIYRGAIPNMNGRYFFGDYSTNQVWSMLPINGRAYCLVDHTPQLVSAATPIQGLVGISPAGNGELFLFDIFGNIYLIDRAE